MDLYIYLFIALFSIINPLGAIPVYLGLTDSYSKSAKLKISLKTSINVAVILIVSCFVGKYILSFFGISIDALRIAGGLIILNSGFILLTGKIKKTSGINKQIENESHEVDSVSLTPLAMPMLAGPGAISLLISFNQEHSQWNDLIVATFAIISVGVVIYLILRSADYLSKLLGASGIVAISRLVGFLIISIGVQNIMTSVLHIVNSSCNK